MIKKCTARISTNIKPMAGGTMPPAGWTQLPVGGWVFGEVGTTDVTGFTHFYQANGTLVELGKLCKASLGNLTQSNETEQPVEPPPPVDPPPVVDDTFPPYLPIGAVWQMRFDLLGDDNWTEFYTFKRTE